MSANKIYSILVLIVAAFLASSSAQAAPRSTPVTVVNSDTSPVPVTVQNPASEPQFVGFSSSSVQGDAGLVGMHNACACTSH